MSANIQSLLVPPDVRDSHKNVLRSINSMLTSFDDLDNIGSVVEQAQAQNDDLRYQLSLSHSRIDSLVADTRSSAETHLRSAKALSLQRQALANDISLLSQEMVSSMSEEGGKPTLLEDLETLHRNLKELQSLRGYIQVVEYALKLSESASERIRSAGFAAISSASLMDYKTLQDLVTSLSKTCSVVEDERPLQLVTFVEKIRDKTWADIKGFLSAALLTCSEKLQWPMPVDYASANVDDRKEFERAFLNLLALQHLGEQIKPPDEEVARSENDGLYPLQALVQPFSLRFKYHFDGTRQTNRLDKPEWYFTHILNIVHEHRSFMESVIQPLVSSSKYQGVNAWAEFTLLLLPLLFRKIKRTVPALLSHPSLLAHTIYQALSFDAALVEEGFLISGTSASKRKTREAKQGDADEWNGVSELILANKEWFKTWMEGEKQFAEEQYDAIISAPTAWLIADDDWGEDSSTDSDLKSTNSARQIKALAEQVKDRYSTLPLFSSRIQFLMSVQLPILENYHGRILSSLDAFETLSFAFTRVMPGALGVSLGRNEEGRVNVDANRLTSGVEGVQRLCKALVSAKFIAGAMSAWGEELFFLELWSEINRQKSLRTMVEGNPLLPKLKADAAIPDDSIFDELINRFEKLVTRSEDMIVHQVCREIEGGLQQHFTESMSNPDAEQTNETIALSQSLLAPIALLSSHLTLLRSTLTQTAMTALYRRISSHLADTILHREILSRGRKQISLGEGKAILAECELWIEACHAAFHGAVVGRSSSSSSRVERPWLGLRHAGKLVGMEEGDMYARVTELTFGVNSDDEWENGMMEAIGICELKREDAAKVLRCREDCDR